MARIKNTMTERQAISAAEVLEHCMNIAGSTANMAHATGLTATYITTYHHRKCASPKMAIAISNNSAFGVRRDELRPDLNEFDWQRVEKAIENGSED